MIFFLFFFSYNSYFFGDPLTNYYDVAGQEGSIIFSFFTFDSNLAESIKDYSIQLWPDQTNLFIKIFSYNLINFLNQVWIIVFSLIIAAMLISLYYKIKRAEIIVFSVFILSVLWFNSLDYIVSIGGIIPRYMIATLPFYFAILGYLMNSAFQINFKKISIKHFKILTKSWKSFLVIFFALFLFTSIYYSKPIDAIINQDFDIKNPMDYSDQFPLDSEGLTKESVLVAKHGKLAMQYPAITFDPFTGYSQKTQTWYMNKINEVPIILMKNMINDGYQLYIFKYKDVGDPNYYRYLEEKHGFILREHSKTFCQLLLGNVQETENELRHSDEVCHSFSENN